MIRSIATLIFIFISAALIAQKDTVLVKDLSSSWQTFDDSGVSISYLQRESDIIFFEAPHIESGSLIKIVSNAEFDIWINDQLFLNHFTGIIFVNLDSLLGDDLEVPTLTFYGTDWREGDLVTELYETVKSGREATYGKIGQLGHIDSNTYLVMLGLVVIVVGLYRRFFPGSFSKSYGNPLSLKLRGLSAEENYQGFLATDNLMAVLYLSLIASLLSYYLGYQLIGIGISPDWQKRIFTIIAVSFIGCALLVGKYLWSLLINAIFQFKGFPNIQNQDYVHFLIVLSSLGLVLSVVDYTQFNFTSNFLKSAVIAIYVTALIFFQFWMVIKLDKLYAHRKLMIISYLCTTEFLPSFIIITWLLKS